ncbi:MAG: M48 family metalloprotease [Acidobacteria bacterium]|nr:M48 family metalloprotease [Acidobacteriota bacterium]
MRDYLVESLLHSIVAGFFVEALIAVWRLDAARCRLLLRLVALCLPLVLPLLFGWLAPFRHEDWFIDGPALLAAAHWSEAWPIAPRVVSLTLTAAGAIGAMLFARDLVPVVAECAAPRNFRSADPGHRFADALEAASPADKGRAPFAIIHSAEPLLFVRGAFAPAVVVSTEAVARLDDRQLRAAVAHETAHVIRRDAMLGWIVMALRLAGIVNPVAQILGRAIIRDVEAAADDYAVEVTGDRVALATAIVKLTTEGPATARPVACRNRTLRPDLLAALWGRMGAAAVERRCRRVLARRTSAETRSNVRATATAVVLGTLLFFVV